MIKSDLRQDAGELIIAGFSGKTLPSSVHEALSSRIVGGLILFSRNLESPEQAADLNQAIYSAYGDSSLPFVSIDQEGGRVQRLKEPLTRVPPMWKIGEAGDYEIATKVGQLLGDELAALGYNLDFAPCADVRSNPENQVIGDRAFSADPEVVGRMAGALMLGLTISGMIPCAKHFPGHGDTLADSHFELPVLHHDLERLQRTEIRPFQMLIKAEVPMIMTAHILVPAIDTVHPVTLSEQGIEQLLRRKLKYGGVIVSDDLEMLAVAQRYSIEEMMQLGIRAGVDSFLICHSEEKWRLAYETLVKMGESNEFDREKIAMAAGRVRKLKRDYLRPWQRPENLREHLGTPEHQALVARFF